MGCRLNDIELLSFHEGANSKLYKSLGCHRIDQNAQDLYCFAVWAPNAKAVSVVGDFNGWDPKQRPMTLRGNMGVWEGYIEGLREGDLYKYHIITNEGGERYKADPFAFYSELRPKTASRVWEPSFEWDDAEYMERRGRPRREPMCVYEIHAGSWKNGNYRSLADELAPYALGLGFTHIQFLPLSEHVSDASWGYQATGLFSPTSRFGEPADFMYLVNKCHSLGLGVIMDWVSAYLPFDEHGLSLFDGTPLFEPADFREPNRYGTAPFDFDKPEVRSFLLSNAMFWLREYHLDGLHLSNVSAMLFPAHGCHGDARLESESGKSEGAVRFFADLNAALRDEFPDVILSAEEFSGVSNVTKHSFAGGLGMDYKWDGAFTDHMLEYMALDPLYRKWHHNRLTATMMAAFDESRVLPFSHSIVAQGKGSLLDRMPGEYTQKFDQLRLLLAYAYAHPGKKLLFMGSELAQFNEWRHDKPLDWMLLDFEKHLGMKRFVEELNGFYRTSPAFYVQDDSWEGFQWLNVNDEIHSIISFARILKRTDGDGEYVACVFNFSPNPYDAYRLGVAEEGIYETVFNSACKKFGGGWNDKVVFYVTQPIGWNEQPRSLVLHVPGYSAIFLSRIARVEDGALAE